MAPTPNNPNPSNPSSLSEAAAERLSAYVDGELSDAERAEVEQLLAENAVARQELAELQQVAGYVSELKRRPAVDLSTAVQQAIVTKTAGLPADKALDTDDTPSLTIGRSPRSWAYAALALAAAILVMVLVPQENGEVENIAAVTKSTSTAAQPASEPAAEPTTEPRPPLELHALPDSRTESVAAEAGAQPAVDRLAATPPAPPMPTSSGPTASGPTASGPISSGPISEPAFAPQPEAFERPARTQTLADLNTSSGVRGVTNSLVLNVLVNRQERSSELVQTALRDNGIEIAPASLSELAPQTRLELARLGLEPKREAIRYYSQLGRDKGQLSKKPASLSSPPPPSRSPSTEELGSQKLAPPTGQTTGQATQFFAQRILRRDSQRLSSTSGPQYQSHAPGQSDSYGLRSSPSPQEGIESPPTDIATENAFGADRESLFEESEQRVAATEGSYFRSATSEQQSTPGIASDSADNDVSDSASGEAVGNSLVEDAVKGDETIDQTIEVLVVDAPIVQLNAAIERVRNVAGSRIQVLPQSHFSIPESGRNPLSKKNNPKDASSRANESSGIDTDQSNTAPRMRALIVIESAPTADPEPKPATSSR